MDLHTQQENVGQSLDCIPIEQEQLLCRLSAISNIDLSQFGLYICHVIFVTSYCVIKGKGSK